MKKKTLLKDKLLRAIAFLLVLSMMLFTIHPHDKRPRKRGKCCESIKPGITGG